MLGTCVCTEFTTEIKQDRSTVFVDNESQWGDNVGPG